MGRLRAWPARATRPESAVSMNFRSRLVHFSGVKPPRYLSFKTMSEKPHVLSSTGLCKYETWEAFGLRGLRCEVDGVGLGGRDAVGLQVRGPWDYVDSHAATPLLPSEAARTEARPPLSPKPRNSETAKTRNPKPRKLLKMQVLQSSPPQSPR